MSYEIKMGPEGILRIKMAGNMDNGIVENFRREYSPYINASTPENPLRNLFFFENLEKISSMIRWYLIELSQDPRFGYSAFIQPSRTAKILGQFILKASQREHIRFFESESEAIAWLQLEN